jgi:hypothetical protein
MNGIWQDGKFVLQSTIEGRLQERDELREEIEQYKWLLEQAKTLRKDNMYLREERAKLTRDRDEWMRRAIAAEGHA